jgi:hyperosmotically inducible periplasmic protein
MWRSKLALPLLCSMALAAACDRHPKQTVYTVAARQQPASEADQELGSSIRQAIVDDDSLSTTAKSVTVASLDGVVTLRGRVESPGEKQAIAAIARRAPGVKRVDDRIGIVLR